MTINSKRNIIELSELGDDITDIESLKESMNRSITELNFILRSLTLVNFDGVVLTGTIPASGSLRLPHKLGIVPKYWITVSQVGGGSITESAKDNSSITLDNSGGTAAEIAVLIVKE